MKDSIGEPVLRDIYGTMLHEGAQGGVVVTTGKVSRQAKKWVADKPIRIIELNELVNLIRTNFSENDVVPDNFNANPVKVSKNICPSCGSKLRIVKWSGKSFVGCTGYPECRYTRNKA